MKPPFSARRRAGFTLLEVMVAIAILGIIVVAIAQIVGTASSLTTLDDKHIDADGQARTVFDRMANDFARMVKRNDVDYIFFKASTAGVTGTNDTMFFFSEGASYFDSATFTKTPVGYLASAPTPTKNAVSLVGYRVNDNSEVTAGRPTYYQMERLGKALSWDGTPSINPVVFLTFPPPGTDVVTAEDSSNKPPSPYNPYSTAFFGSTLWGAYSIGNGRTPSLVGTAAKNFNNGAATDSSFNTKASSPYHPLAPQVFRFEFAFQLKDGVISDKPVMDSSAANGIPTSNLTATAPPVKTSDSAAGYSAGSRWYDTTRHIGYICLDATAGYAVWRPIGIRDIAAVVVTIAVIDKQGLVFVKNKSIDMAKLSQALADGVDATVAKTWLTATAPTSAGANSPVATATGLPQQIVSQVRVYQRFFYINNL